MIIIQHAFVIISKRHDINSNGADNQSCMNTFGLSDEYRREELIRMIEHSVEKLTIQELEALYYDMITKSYINESQ